MFYFIISNLVLHLVKHALLYFYLSCLYCLQVVIEDARVVIILQINVTHHKNAKTQHLVNNQTIALKVKLVFAK